MTRFSSGGQNHPIQYQAGIIESNTVLLLCTKAEQNNQIIYGASQQKQRSPKQLK